MAVKLSILIPTLPARKHFYDKLVNEQLLSQIKTYMFHNGDESQIEILSNDLTGITIGAKRNLLVSIARGQYIAFVDDDDRIADSYIDLVMAGIATNPDCCSLHGIITTDGKNPQHFYHSIKYKEFYTQDNVHYRCPNHLNVVRAELAKQCEFPDWKYSEDSNYAFQLRDKGLLKVEYEIPGVLYYYDFISDKRY